MNNRIYITAVLLFIMGCMAMSCEKELSVKRNYDFEIKTAKYHEEISQGETKTFDFKIEKEGDYKGAEYYVSYFLRSGAGTVSDADWNVLEENDYYPVPNDSFILRYTAHEAGTHKIELTIKDASGKEKETVINLTAEE